MAGGANPQNVQAPRGMSQIRGPSTPKPDLFSQMQGQQGPQGVQVNQPAAPAPAPMPQATQAAPQNIFQQSSNAYTQALQGTAAAGMARPMGVMAQNVRTRFGYNPANVGAASVGTQFGYDPSQVSSQGVGTQFGYDPSQVSAQGVGTQFGYGPQNVQAGSAAGGINTYMNPYNQQVIDTTMADLERQRLMQQNQLGAQATAARAFGGSRQGIAEAETNRAFAQQGGQLAAQLRQQGFQTALGASQQDVANQMQAALANQAAGGRAAEFGQQTGLQAQGMNQQAAMQAALANQAAQAQAAQFGQQTGLQAQQANQQAALQAALANQAAGGRAAEFGQQLGFQGQQANQQAAMQAALANQAAQAQAAQFGQQTGLQAQGMNQQAALQAALANQSAGAQAAQLGLAAAGQLGNLSQQGFNMGQSINQQQQQFGTMQQAINQALIDAARAQYGGFTGAPMASLSAPLAALGAANMGQNTSTQTQQPGLFNYLSLGLGALSDIRLKDDIKPAGEISGVRFYTWNWNETGKRLADPKQPTFGVIADEVAVSHPQHVARGADGYLRVNYAGLIGELRAA